VAGRFAIHTAVFAMAFIFLFLEELFELGVFWRKGREGNGGVIRVF